MPVIEIIRGRGFRQDSQHRKRYDQEQRKVETEIMLALRDELTGWQETLSKSEQHDYETEVEELNAWIRCRMN